MFIFPAISFFSGVLSIFIGNIVYFQSSKKPVHRLFLLLCLLNAFWGFTEFMLRQASNVNDAIFWLQVFSLSIMAIPVALHFSLLYTGRAAFLQSKCALTAIYISVLAISISNPFLEHAPASMVEKMPWGYVPVLASSNTLRNIALLWLVIINLCTIILILYHLVKANDHKKKRQTLLVALGIIVPIILANLSHFLLPIVNVKIPELTTVGTTLQALFIGFAIWKYDLFEINPATAANNIVSTMSDIFILLEPRGKILSINQAATNLLAYYENDVIRKPITSILSGKVTEHFLFTEARINGKSISTDAIKQKLIRNLEGILVAKGGKKIPASVALSTLWNLDGSIAGYVVIARDISKQKQIESEREGLINKLQDAFSNIKVLRGLLPICANCKKIRDDEGYWQDMAVYIRDHSEANFSHGICPDCAEKLYPEIHGLMQK